MRTLIDNETGAVVFIPDNGADRKTLFALMDCTDLTQLNKYLDINQLKNITTDLGLSADLLKDYPVCTTNMFPPVPMETENNLGRQIEDHAEYMNIPPDEECVPYGSLVVDEGRRLIGFCRDSAYVGYKFRTVYGEPGGRVYKGR